MGAVSLALVTTLRDPRGSFRFYYVSTDVSALLYCRIFLSSQLFIDQRVHTDQSLTFSTDIRAGTRT